MTDDAQPEGRTAASRRAILTAAAWTAPAIASTFVPAVAQSGRTVPVAKVRIGPDYSVLNESQYDPATNTNRGPIVVYVTALYDQNIVWWPTPDPRVVVVPYVVSVSGPLGSTSLSGSLMIALGGYAQDVRWYPGKTQFPVPPGEYVFTLTIYGSDGSTSSTTRITIS